MMHGTIHADETHMGTPAQRVVGFIRQRARLLLIVVLPTLLVMAYYGLIAANQYESEAHFIVRSTQSATPTPTGLGQALSLIGGTANSNSDSASVADYLSSHEAVDLLRDKVDLVGMFRRPEADLLSKLTPANPSPERLLRYYRSHADVKLETESGITTIHVRTFRPADSYRIVNELMAMGESRVNSMNDRAYESTLAMARRQLADAERALSVAQSRLTSFRQVRRNIDPMATGQAQIGVVSNLQAALALARAQRASMAGLGAGSPQVRAMDARVRALEGQVGAESAHLTGNRDAIAADVGDYQGLQLRQQFAAKRYDEAAAALQRARDQAVKQQLFLVRVVQPNMPVKALYPKSFKVVFTVFVALALAYALGWLIAAGVREHTA
jgi:capsular polysaccharide transport system permease protein